MQVAAKKRGLTYEDLSLFDKEQRRGIHDDITVTVIYLDRRSPKIRTSASTSLLSQSITPADIVSYNSGASVSTSNNSPLRWNYTVRLLSLVVINKQGDEGRSFSEENTLFKNVVLYMYMAYIFQNFVTCDWIIIASQIFLPTCFGFQIANYLRQVWLARNVSSQHLGWLIHLTNSWEDVSVLYEFFKEDMVSLPYPIRIRLPENIRWLSWPDM